MSLLLVLQVQCTETVLPAAGQTCSSLMRMHAPTRSMRRSTLLERLVEYCHVNLKFNDSFQCLTLVTFSIERSLLLNSVDLEVLKFLVFHLVSRFLLVFYLR